jgi:cytochrome b
MKKVLLWDLPLRVFHWSLAALVIGAVSTGLIGGGLMEWHGRIGVAIAALLGFRLAWGIIGSTYARFGSFVRGPGTVVAYLRGQWQGLGHNPLGAYSVLGLLGVLGAQVATGLFGNDDVAFRGPYNALISGDAEIFAVYLHKRIFWLLAILVALHLCAIAFYAWIKRDNLVKPMLTGHKEIPPDHPAAAAPPQRARPIGLVTALAVAFGMGWVAQGGLLPYLAPPPPPPAETPNW